MAAKYGSRNIRRGGSITLTSGVAGVRPQKGFTVSASICGAVESLTRALAVELSPLRVNAVCFGLMRTELWDGIPEEHRNAMYENTGKSLPVGRVGEPEDGAEAFLYLMREKYSTGQIIVVDGVLLWFKFLVRVNGERKHNRKRLSLNKYLRFTLLPFTLPVRPFRVIQFEFCKSQESWIKLKKILNLLNVLPKSCAVHRECAQTRPLSPKTKANPHNTPAPLHLSHPAEH